MAKKMNEKEFYTTVGASAEASFTDRGSKFIAYSFPVKDVADCKLRLNEIKKAHPKATHHCFAYRLGIDSYHHRVSDAGEPAGSAGKPILGQIDSRELTDTLVIVVRYFGGSLLGVPGLINAYKSAATLALQVTPLVQKQVTQAMELNFDYTQMNEVMRTIKQMGIEIIEQEVQLFCRYRVAVPKNKLEQFEYHLRNLKGVEVSPVKE
jgi:uncharacterized YigZ family protein